MRILLGNNSLRLFAGSETWTKTLALQLKKMGHEVFGFSTDLGEIAKELEDNGIRCFKEISENGIKPFSIKLEEPITHTYDLIIANHFAIVEKLRSIFPKTPIISTIHGIIHEAKDQRGNTVKAPEHPAEAGVNQFIAVSEEVQNILKEKYNIDSNIIRNFVNIDEFRAKRKINPGKPKTILLNTNYASKGDPEVEVLRKVAKHYDAKLIAIGENFVITPKVMELIEQADVVVGMGRSVLEGLSAGRICIVHGRWGTGGVINKESVEELRAVNFSGRNARDVFWTEQEFIDAIDKNYNQETADWGREYVKRDHNVIFAASEFLSIGRMLLGEEINKPKEVRRIPYCKQKDV